MRSFSSALEICKSLDTEIATSQRRRKIRITASDNRELLAEYFYLELKIMQHGVVFDNFPTLERRSNDKE